MPRPFTTIAVLLTLAAPLAAQQGEPEIIVELSRDGRRVDQVYEGQPVTYAVLLNNVQNPSPPELEGFDDFDVTPQGDQRVDVDRSITINFRTTEIHYHGRQYRYKLVPRKSGELTVPAPKATVDGRVVTGPELKLTVVPPGQQDVVAMKITADRADVYPMQPFTVTLSVAVRGLPEPVADRSPLSVQDPPPQLDIPWAIDDDLPDGLQPDVEWRQWLRPMQRTGSGGFRINKIRGQRSVFSMFDESLTFLPTVRRVSRHTAGGGEAEYWEYLFARTFVAEKVGQYAFGPATLEGPFVVDIQDRRARFQDVYAVADAIEVAVRDAPEEGRPPTFTGAIGQFQLAAELEPRKVKVGDPMTLTLTLTGEGTLAGTLAPDLEKVPAIAGRFKLYEATQETRDGASVFTYSLRPLEEGDDPFPPVEMAYFDVEQEKYAKLRTEPIPIQVAAADRLSAGQIVAAPRSGPATGRDLTARGEGIFANVTGLDELRDQSVRPGRWLAGLGGLAGLYAAVAVGAVGLRRRLDDPARVRRRAAPAKARRRLRNARAELDGGPVREGAELVRAALVGLVADVAGVPEGGLTPKDTADQVRHLGGDDGVAARLGDFLETCDAVRYASTGHRADRLGRDAETLLEDIIRALKAERRFR